MRPRAFTLVEMVVALTIVAILLTLAFPAMKALREQGNAQIHVTAFLDLARVMRARAISEQRPYQVVFDQQSIYGLRYFYPYGEETTFQEFLLKQDEERLRRKEEIARMEIQRMQMAQDAPENPEGGEAVLPPLPNIDDEYFVRKVALPEGVKVEVRAWGEHQWKNLDGAVIHRWVFQPSGLCDPLQIRFASEGQWQELHFDVLTGDLNKKRFYAQ
ncbi:MAG: prepilin-type N-terminal cleavage/methylation domain-containing protein [Verrucomicrobiales bacterium]|jgi:prepilin-type N-terminal cleavage/methylation domain-containing protein